MISTSTEGSSAHQVLPRAAQNERAGVIRSFYGIAARLDRVGFGMLRLGLVVVLCWIGGLKAANYEAEGIVPFVANSPFMNFFYHHPAPDYREQNPAGGLNIASHEWNETNGTYVFSYGLGCVIVALGILIALHPLFPQVAAVGSFLVILMACTTLSFLVTTPEAWVSGSGNSVHGFPFLALPGLLVVKDSIMLGAAHQRLQDNDEEFVTQRAHCRDDTNGLYARGRAGVWATCPASAYNLRFPALSYGESDITVVRSLANDGQPCYPPRP